MISHQTYRIAADAGDSMVDFIASQFTTLAASVVPPSYPPRVSFVDSTVNFDLSANWTGDVDPSGFTVDQLPTNLSMNAQGVVTGTASPSGQNVAVTVSNSGVSADSFQWSVIDVPPVGDPGEGTGLGLNLSLRI